MTLLALSKISADPANLIVRVRDHDSQLTTIQLANFLITKSVATTTFRAAGAGAINLLVPEIAAATDGGGRWVKREFGDVHAEPITACIQFAPHGASCVTPRR